jgi:hypothetical protein
VDADVFVADDVLLTSTSMHRYPDAAHRIARGLTDLVEFPAPVLFSMAPGYTSGAH